MPQLLKTESDSRLLEALSHIQLENPGTTTTKITYNATKILHVAIKNPRQIKKEKSIRRQKCPAIFITN